MCVRNSAQRGVGAPWQITDTDALITVLKACLRSANQHLSTATVAALVPLFPLLITRPALGASASTSPHASTSSVSATPLDVPTLRHALTAFLPAGGLIDKLGDTRERAREHARDALVLLGGYAFRASGAASSLRAGKGGPETPLALFERHFREGGLAAKGWRVREGAVGALAALRRAHHAFPLRPFLGPLVDALEDGDSNVRTQAQAAVIELFTGPGVTDAARADLKKEMAKKNVRRAIVESVTAKLLAAGAGGGGSTTPAALSENGSENGDGAYVPPSTSLLHKTPALGKSMSRSVSGNMDKLSRPASRAAAISPLPGDPAASSASDVKAVYVSVAFLRALSVRY